MASGLSESRPDHQRDRYDIISARFSAAAFHPNISLPYAQLPRPSNFLSLSSSGTALRRPPGPQLGRAVGVSSVFSESHVVQSHSLVYEALSGLRQRKPPSASAAPSPSSTPSSPPAACDVSEEKDGCTRPEPGAARERRRTLYPRHSS